MEFTLTVSEKKQNGGCLTAFKDKKMHFCCMSIGLSEFPVFLLSLQVQEDDRHGDRLSKHPAVLDNFESGFPSRDHWTPVSLSTYLYRISGC